MAPSEGLTAVILAGGRGSRLGRNKALLPLGNCTLIERLVGELSRGFAEIVVVGAQRSSFPEMKVRVIRDTEPFPGPVPSLRRGLEAAGSEIVFACACDLPMLRVSVALTLCGLLRDHDAVIPLIGDKPQPLHAVYRKRCACVLDEMAQSGEMRLTEIVTRLDARIPSEAELRRLDPDLLSFFNLNTEHDYRRALRLLEKTAAT